MKIISAIVLLVAAVEAHYVFKNTVIRGKKTGDWENVRKTANYQDLEPVTDMTSKSMRCYQLSTGNGGATTMNVTAGETVGYVAYQVVAHPGPASFWMAKAPSGETADTMTGEGSVWFKIHQDYPTKTADGFSWPSQGKVTLDVQIPKCIPSGDYLLRVEHIGIQPVAVANPSLWLSCAQLRVTEGTGSLPKSLVSIPGAYQQSDPGLHFNLNGHANYTAPGPAPLTCS